MNIVKANCSCCDVPVNSIQESRIAWATEWGFFTIILFIVLTLMSGGLWAFFVVGWNISRIFNPYWRCAKCSERIYPSQFE